MRDRTFGRGRAGRYLLNEASWLEMELTNPSPADVDWMLIRLAQIEAGLANADRGRPGRRRRAPTGRR